MASIKNLKKDVNFILADIIDDCLLWQLENPKADTAESEKVISEAIEVFDKTIIQINQKDVKDKKAHFKNVVSELKSSAATLLERVEKL